MKCMAARSLSIVGALIAATSVGTARATTNSSANLLAPPGACGAAADRLNLDTATAQRAMLCLTNYARRRVGVEPLVANPLLNAAGQAKLDADISCGDFSHTPCSRPFEGVFSAYIAGATSYRLGENIAWGTGDFGAPRQTMAAWLNSSGHRRNILNGSFHELGVGYLADQTFQGASGATFWSQEFGTRSPVRHVGARR
jgi:uncharacterized protein YkwD